MNKPETDPVLVYFNGGPGATSIIVAFNFIGPLVSVNETGNLAENANTWCQFANVLWIDNPAGVGFSYAERDIDVHTSDFSFSRDILTFFKLFYADWPELYDNPLYIVGLSYGGNYAPYTTYTLHTFNAELALNKTTTDKPFPLKGFIAANGVTDFDTDPFIATVDTYYGFSAISQQLYQEYLEAGCIIYW